MDVMDFDTSHLSSVCSDMLDDGIIFVASDSISDCAKLCGTTKWSCFKIVKKLEHLVAQNFFIAGSGDTESFIYTL
jgi:hypothetical protein